MRFSTYTKYRGGWLDAMNLESLMESLSDFLLNGGFAGGPNYHPFWGWSGTEDTSSVDSLKNALLQALIKSGQLTPEMIEELRGDGQGDEAVQQQIAELLDDLIQRMVEEGYLTLEDGAPTMPGAIQDVTGMGEIDEAKEAAQQVQFNLTQKGNDFLGYGALKGLLSALGTSSLGSHETPHLATGVETIDRFLFRSSAGIEIEPLAWRQASEFVDPQGNPLSDHDPISVSLLARSVEEAGR